MGTKFEVKNTGVVDFQQNGTEQFVLEQGTVDPSGVLGQIFYRTDTNELRIHNGSNFQPLSAAAGGWQDTGVVVKLITNTDQIQIGDGSVGTPAFAFESEPGTGIYREGSNSFDFAVAGTKRFELGNAGINLHGNIFIGVSNGSTSTLFVSHGTEAAPSLIFSNLETDTGFFRIGADNIGMSFEGTLKVDFNSSRTIFKNQVQVSNGSAASPSFSFESDPDTGIFAPAGSNFLAIATGGSQRFTIDSTEGIVSTERYRSPDGTVGLPTYSFQNDTNTGIFRIGADNLGFSTAGVKRMDFTTTMNMNTNILMGTFDITNINNARIGNGSAANPTLSFESDTDTGIFRPSDIRASLRACN